MAKFCKTCGSELPDNAMICTQCGTILGSGEYSLSGNAFDPEITEPVSYIQEPVEGPKKKGKWWLAPVAALLALVIAGAFLWRPIMCNVAPEAYLAMCAAGTLKGLSQRDTNSPLRLLEKAEQYLQKGTLAVEADYSDVATDTDLLITMASDREAKRWAVHTEMNTAYCESSYVNSGYLDLYFDAESMALSSDSLIDGQYFGLEYNTFAQELPGSYLGRNMDQESIESLTRTIETVEKAIDSPMDHEAMLKPYLDIISAYIENLTAEIGTDSIELDDEMRKCETIAYTLAEDEVVDLLERLVERMENDADLRDYFMSMDTLTGNKNSEDKWDDMIQQLRDGVDDFAANSESEGLLTYYIFGGNLAAIGLEADFEEVGGEGEIGLDLLLGFGTDPGVSDITLELKVRFDGEIVRFNCVSSVKTEGNVYSNVLTFTGDAEDSEMELRLETKWDRTNGDLLICVDSEVDQEETAFELKMTLVEKENEIELTIHNLSELICALNEEYSAYNGSFDCTLAVRITQGCTIVKPEYTKLTDITEADIRQWYSGDIEGDYYY